MKKKPKGKSRSAKTGKYVTKDFAKKHPNTTVTEKDKKQTDLETTDSTNSND